MIEEKQPVNSTAIPSEDKQKEIIKQFQAEYKLGTDYLDDWYQTKERQLKLYNNQKKNKNLVGEPILFTVIDTLQSSLYDDKMTVGFLAREEGDTKVEEGLNALARYDYDEMDKEQLDRGIIWDFLFFSYAFVDMTGFDWNRKTPMPYLLDPLNTYYDPKAESVDGNKNGKGAMRFLGQTFMITRRELEKRKDVYFNTELLKSSGKSISDRLQLSHDARSDAAGKNQQLNDGLVGDNEEFKITEHRTWIDGKRYLIGLGNEGKTLVRFQEIKGDTWGIVAYRLWPQPHQFMGVAVTDLVEDKQRMKAVLLNTGIKVLKSSLYPNYAYNKNLVYNKRDLMKAGFNKYIPVKDNPNNVIAPLQTKGVDLAIFNYLMQEVDTQAQKATATPEIQQGINSKGKTTLGELQIQQSKVDTRYGLLVKSVIAGEKDFWKQWYFAYKNKFADAIAEKVLRIAGTTSPKFRVLTRENIIAVNDPDVQIDSSLLSEQAQMRIFSRWTSIAKIASADPTADKRFILKKATKSAGASSDEVEGAFPNTFDEDMAQKENEMLNGNKSVPVRGTDNHRVHIQIHRQANATKAAFAHIETHREAMLQQRVHPELFPQQQQMQQGMQPGETGQVQTGGVAQAMTDQMRTMGDYQG